MEDKEIIEPDVLASMLMRLFEFAPIAMAITTSDTKSSSYAKVNDAYLKLTGQRWEDICGRKLLSSKGSAIDSPARDRRHRLLAEEGSYVLEEVDIRHADGTIVPTLISAQRTVIDGVSFDVEVILDVSSRVRHQREMESALLESARSDFLTGLPNRAGFEVELASRLSLKRSGELALVYIDLNGFKPVNDSMGHAAGDDVLKTIASRLRENFRTGDYIARVGGDEFVILLDVETHKVAGLLLSLEEAAERIFKPVAIEGQVADVGAAVGIAFLQPGDTGISFTKRADSYMYIAKASRERVAIVALGAAMPDMAAAVLSERIADVG